MRSALLIILLFIATLFEAQTTVPNKWNIQCGVSTANAFAGRSAINVRYVSPRFKWSDEWSADEEKNPERYKNMRLMLEMIYAPPLTVLCTGFNAQYRLVNCKRFSTYVYGGLKCFFVQGNDFVLPPALSRGNIWYMNMGLQMQLDLGMILPYADLGGDGIITVGAEFNLRKIYKRPKGRYNLKRRDVK